MGIGDYLVKGSQLLEVGVINTVSPVTQQPRLKRSGEASSIIKLVYARIIGKQAEKPRTMYMLPPIAFFGQTWGGERLGDLFPRVVPVYCQHAALLRNFPLPQLSAFESDNAAAVRL